MESPLISIPKAARRMKRRLADVYAMVPDRLRAVMHGKRRYVLVADVDRIIAEDFAASNLIHVSRRQVVKISQFPDPAFRQIVSQSSI